MSGQASVEGLKYEHAHVDALGDDRWQEIVTLCTIAYDYQDFEHLLRLYPDTTHILARLDDQLVSHACWVTRWLQPGDHKPLRTAYIEAVATDPSHQHRTRG